MNWPEKLVLGVYCVAGTVAILAFYTALTTDGTDEDPAGVAGLYAPLIALSVAFMIVAEAFRLGTRLFVWLRAIGIGVGSSLSAYLWMADEAEVHPSNLKLLFDLSPVLGLGVIFTLLLMFIIIPEFLGSGDSDD